MPEIELLNQTFVPDRSGLLYWPAERLLVVSDMHLEKGSAFASRGQMLPPYDSAATLAKLMQGLTHFRPRILVSLGDSFHDTHAFERLHTDTRETLMALGKGIELIWISGNHDPVIPAMLPGKRMEELVVGSITFRHEPHGGAFSGEVAGHLHPVGKVVTVRGSVRKPAFVTDGQRLIMPAFGAYAGGLNVQSDAIRKVFGYGTRKAYVCGKTRVFKIDENRLSPD